MRSPISFVALPSETIAWILELTDPLDIRRCQQVCRRFRDLVANNQYLQYMLELDACGYVVPPKPRIDLSYAEKIQALREHRVRWQRPELVKPTFIPHPRGDISMTCFVDGVIARGLAPADPAASRECIRTIYFDRLPSWNQGTGHTHWHHDLGFDAVRFVIHPKPDLLVVLEKVANGFSTGPFDVPGPGSNEHFRVHFRTMSNNPHPVVTSPLGAVLDLNLSGHGSGMSYRFRSYQMQIYGRLLAVVFITEVFMDRKVLAKVTISIKIIDWVAGSVVSEIDAGFQGSNHFSFGFLSEKYFILARSAHVRSSPAPGSRALSPLGYLDIYCLSSPRRKSQPLKARRITSFLLPDLQINQITSSMELCCSPARTTPASLSTQFEHPAEIFQSATGNELLVMDIRLSTLDRNINHGYGYVVKSSVGTLYIPIHVLECNISKRLRGGARSKGSRVSIPWNTWGHHLYARWFNGSFTGPRESNICGQRSVTVHTSDAVEQADDSKLQLVISDFSPKRMRAWQANWTDEREFSLFPSGVAHKPPSCTKTRFEVERDGEGGAVKATLIDDEHVLIRVARGDDGGSPGIYVYTL